MKKNTLLYVALMAFATVGFTTAKAVEPAATTATPAPAAVVTPAAADIVVDATSTTGFESLYVFRGQKSGNDILFENLSFDFTKYVNWDIEGIWNTVPTTRQANFGELDNTLSLNIPLEAAKFSVGATLYDYPNATVISPIAHQIEEYAELSYQAFLNPYVKAAYNDTLKEIYAEAGVSQKVPLFFIKGFSLVPSVSVGYAGVRDALPNNQFNITESYRYAAGALDLTYTYKGFDLSVGGRLDYTSGMTPAASEAMAKYTKLTWWGGSVGFKF